ncbi:MAG: ribonuclease I [Pseudomonadota bacterium]|nr:ribonuclease I [Pseudomonadota bacterium]
MRKLLLAVASIMLAPVGGASAQQVELQGYFIAFQDCGANRRKDSDNPGNVRLERMRAYEMVARNDTPGTHYQVKVPGAPAPQERWVAMGCGAFAPRDDLVMSDDPGAQGDGDSGGRGGSGGAVVAADSIELVLAASWQPGFCVTASGRGKLECQSQTTDRFDATHFAIHGLWPDDLDDPQIFPCYCGRGAPVSCRGSQDRDASIDISDAVLEKLTVAMPGVQSGLHLHEWPKHGACYEDDKSGADRDADPDEYFGETMALLEQLNASPVQALFEAKLGEVVTRDEIEAAFDEAFGDGAGDRVLVRCSRVGGENIIGELWIGLKGEISQAPDFKSLIQAAPETETSTDNQSCNSGRVVKVAD